ncbi:MAG: hypothetical protein BGO86_12230 [Chryseobacterium sp. 36-9]|nr:MAG: hypothetical protein BGO86_12230 [Chryseobacterium sp. 36-9]
MKAKLLYRFVLLIIILFILSFTLWKSESIDGSWTFVKVENINNDGTKTIVFPKQSQAIFSGKLYSFCWSADDSNGNFWLMTDNEKLNRMNRTIVNTGDFYFKNGYLFTEAKYALNPKFVGGVAKFDVSYTGDTLVLKCTSVLSKDNVMHPFYSKAYSISKLIKNKKNL